MDQYAQLLQKIADNTGHSDSMWVAIIAGAAGVFGAGITALFGYLTMRKSQQIEEKKLRASIITAERLRWLQEVRQRLASFYVQLDMQFNWLKRPIPQTDEEKKEYQCKLDEFSNVVNEQWHIITLMINPAKPDQNDLKSALQEALVLVKQHIDLRNAVVLGKKHLIFPLKPHEVKFDDQNYKRIKTKAFDSLTKIGIDTWNRIKELK